MPLRRLCPYCISLYLLTFGLFDVRFLRLKCHFFAYSDDVELYDFEGVRVIDEIKHF